MAISSTNHRVLVTLTREQNELLTDLARFQGRSKGSYLRELMDGAEPMFRALVPVLRVHAATIDGQPVAVRDVVSKVLTGAYGAEAAPLLDQLEAMADRIAAGHSADGVPSGARAYAADSPASPKRKSRR